MNKAVPIFYDHSSYKSLLTYWSFKDLVPDGPRSIIKLCTDNKITQFVGISNTFASFPEAYKGAKKAGLDFIFGIEFWLCDNRLVRDEASLANEHKVFVLMKNSQGYQDLIKLYTAVHSDKENFYYKARFDCASLKQYWTENLVLWLPFFDSFIAKNTLKHKASIVPDFPVEPALCREQDSEHPHQQIIDLALDRYNKEGKLQEVKSKTIFYEKREDMFAYMTYRCMKNRSNMEKPEMDEMCSPAFSFEDYLKLVAE